MVPQRHAGVFATMPIRRIALTSFFLAMPIAPAAWAQQAPPCFNEMIPLRDSMEQHGKAVKAAVDSKDRAKVCENIKRYASTEAKYLKFLQDNQSWCGIPPQIIEQVKGSHANTLKVRGQACAAGPVGARPGPPPGPGLSDALGTSRAPTPGTAKTGKGTFDTLTGNPFQR
jgi:hypothetical protein